jgi:hypothetical protein
MYQSTTPVTPGKNHLYPGLATAVLALSLPALCFGGQIVSVSATQVPIQGNPQFEISATGIGRCDVARMKFGDGKFLDGHNIDFAKGPWTVRHVYDGWPGRKRVRVEGVSADCKDSNGSPSSASVVLTVVGGQRTATYAAPSPHCVTLMPHARIRTNTRITISESMPLTNIGFGCPGCFAGPDGQQGQSGNSYPFPGANQYRLVLRAGTEVLLPGFRGSASGGSSSLTTVGGTRSYQPGNTFPITMVPVRSGGNSGPLEICMNDDVPGDNTGAWNVSISIDESDAIDD